nr:unnamed protein product [Digitaria exilis]
MKPSWGPEPRKGKHETHQRVWVAHSETKRDPKVSISNGVRIRRPKSRRLLATAAPRRPRRGPASPRLPALDDDGEPFLGVELEEAVLDASDLEGLGDDNDEGISQSLLCSGPMAAAISASLRPPRHASPSTSTPPPPPPPPAVARRWFLSRGGGEKHGAEQARDGCKEHDAEPGAAAAREGPDGQARRKRRELGACAPP